jgi:hypothetical protein
VPPCEFNERDYEFCANFQLQVALGAYLVGGRPAIPSQVTEAVKGYDAAYKFAGGVAVLIQYKISHFSQRPWGRGAATYAMWGRPYFRAQLHQDAAGGYVQHNTLVATSLPAIALYVAPCFVTNKQLGERFNHGTGSGVLEDSILAPLNDLRRIDDTAAHSFTYPQDGSAFRLHSDASEPYAAARSFRALLSATESQAWGERFFVSLGNELLTATSDADFPGLQSWELDRGPVAEVAAILDRHFNAVLALFPDRSWNRYRD